MKLSLRKKLNQVGMLSLHVIVPLALAVAAIGGIGAYVLKSSHAASALTSSTCSLRGRVWSGTACSKTCQSGAGSPVVASPYDYCSGALGKISYATCVANGRKWLDVGCARRWQQTNLANAPQCATASATYFVENPYDKCGSATFAAAIPKRYPTGAASCGSNQIWDRIDGCINKPTTISKMSKAAYCESSIYRNLKKFDGNYTKWFTDEGGICIYAPYNVQPILAPNPGDAIWCGSGLKYIPEDLLCGLKISTYDADYSAYLKK